MDRAARLARAEAFLQEAVFQSRAQQAAGTFLAQAGENAAQCGLGARAEIVLDLSPRATELFAELWPAGLAPESHLDPCGNIDRLMLSARTGAGLDALRGALTDRVAQARQSAEPRLPHPAGTQKEETRKALEDLFRKS